MKKIFCLILLLMNFISSYALEYEEDYLKGKIIKKVSEIKEIEDENIEGIIKYEVKILEKPYNGEIIEVEFPIYKQKQYNINPKVGDKIVLYKTIDYYKGEKIEKFYISDVDKRNDLIIAVSMFLVFVLLIAKMKGFYSLIGLVSTIIFIVEIFIPAIAKGYSPIIFAVITAIFSSIISMIFIVGLNRKFLVAIIGTTSGVMISGIFSCFFVYHMRLTGYLDSEVLSYAEILKNINIKELISAGIIIGSLGAVMDVAVSIASSINELYINNQEITCKRLYSSSMKIGDDIIGTMINTLILAYIGSSLLMIILIYMQFGDYPLIRIFNYENIAVEILRSVSGSIGIVISVPITSYIGAKIYTYNKKNKNNMFQ